MVSCLMGDSTALASAIVRCCLKKFLNHIIQEELSPIRKRREAYEKDIASVYDILKSGCEAARMIAQKTLDEVKAAMQINYFDDDSFIQTYKEKYEN